VKYKLLITPLPQNPCSNLRNMDFYYNIFKYYCLKFVNAPYVYIPSLSFSQSEFVERFPELSLFFKAYSPLDSEMICIFPYFCPYAESAREIREIFS